MNKDHIAELNRFVITRFTPQTGTRWSICAGIISNSIHIYI